MLWPYNHHYLKIHHILNMIMLEGCSVTFLLHNLEMNPPYKMKVAYLHTTIQRSRYFHLIPGGGGALCGDTLVLFIVRCESLIFKHRPSTVSRDKQQVDVYDALPLSFSAVHPRREEVKRHKQLQHRQQPVSGIQALIIKWQWRFMAADYLIILHKEPC